MDYDKDFEEGYEQTSLGAIHFKHHTGTKEKIIFLHGMGSSMRAWKKMMEYMSSDLDIFLLDLMGHGESDAPQLEYSISMQFQALREFIALRNNGDSYLFGHSYGAWLAAYYAGQGGSCKGIVLEDSAGAKQFFDDVEKNGNSSSIKENLLNLSMMVAGNHEEVLKNMLDNSFKEDHLDTELLSGISVPTMILWGSEDNMMDKKYAEFFSSAINGSTVHIIEGAGHDPHFAKAEEVARLLQQFINANSKRP